MLKHEELDDTAAVAGIVQRQLGKLVQAGSEEEQTGSEPVVVVAAAQFQLRVAVVVVGSMPQQTAEPLLAAVVVVKLAVDLYPLRRFAADS